MKAKWDERYSAEEYIYGTAPNDFLKNCLDSFNKQGTILFPAEGEGRNAVYAAQLGWDVFAFDQSEVAKQKAEKLAAINNVNIQYEICDIEDYFAAVRQFDVIGIIYVHLPSVLKQTFFKNVIKSLKKGGSIIMEVFSKEQLSFTSGGPLDTDLLYDIDELKKYFSELEIEEISKHEITLNEGLLHKGKASVIRIIAKKI